MRSAPVAAGNVLTSFALSTCNFGRPERVSFFWFLGRSQVSIIVWRKETVVQQPFWKQQRNKQHGVNCGEGICLPALPKSAETTCGFAKAGMDDWIFGVQHGAASSSSAVKNCSTDWSFAVCEPLLTLASLLLSFH